MKKLLVVLFVVFSFGLTAVGQETATPTESTPIEKIKKEGYDNSHVMEYASYLTDVYGPRLTWSPEYKRGADWVAKELKRIGLTNITFDEWEPEGKGWTLRKFSANMVAPVTATLIAHPKAWAPGTDGPIRGKAVHLKVEKKEDLEAYEGRLKNAFVFLSDPRDVEAHFEPQGSRLSDSALLVLANAADASGQGRRRMRDSSAMQRYFDRVSLNAAVMNFAKDEGAAVIVTASSGDGGTVFVSGATVPHEAHSIAELYGRPGPYSDETPELLPQVAMASEHYNRVIRMLEKGQKVELEMNIDVAWTRPVPGFNIIAEIPGTDLKDQIVMIGAHFDSWHAGTGGTDNSSGSAVCLEALRIIKAAGLMPRRTIRIGLWGGEEEGLYGSREYVKEYLARTKSGEDAPWWSRPDVKDLATTKEYDKFSVYFNNDNGTGKVRGVYLQGNEAARPVFREWLEEVNDPSAQTLTIRNTSGTDHLSFDAVGLPGFQFIQDPIEYDTRTHHSNMDVYDRIQPDDIKQGAVFMAIFAYKAAMQDDLFPRKPDPADMNRPSSSSAN